MTDSGTIVEFATRDGGTILVKPEGVAGIHPLTLTDQDTLRPVYIEGYSEVLVSKERRHAIKGDELHGTYIVEGSPLQVADRLGFQVKTWEAYDG